jgi:hypothetical protein
LIDAKLIEADFRKQKIRNQSVQNFALRGTGKPDDFVFVLKRKFKKV